MDSSDAQGKIDALVARFFAAFDNRGGAKPRVEEMAGCFADKATIARRSGGGAELYTVEEFAIPRVDLLTRGALVDFHETETSAVTQILSGIAIRTSRYRKSGSMDGKPYSGSGTKCFQLIESDSGWRIASLAWVDDE